MSDFKQLSDFNSTPVVQSTDLIYSQNVTTGIEQATTVAQLETYLMNGLAADRQSLPVVTAGQQLYPTAGYTPGLVNVFVAGIRLSLWQYQATNGTTILITDPNVLTRLVPGMTVELDAIVSLAVANVATQAQVQALIPTNLPPVNPLTGAELFSISQSGGMFQSTLTKIASFVNSLVNPPSLNASGALTGSEVVAVSQSGNLVRSTLSAIASYVNGLINPSNLNSAAILTGTELFGINQNTALAKLQLSTLATFVLSQQAPGTLLADTGIANAYQAINPSPLTVGTWITGTVQQFTVAHTNTGASTYAPDALLAIPILGEGFLPLTGGEMLVGGIAKLMKMTVAGVNSGNPFCLLLDCSGAPKQVATGTNTAHTTNLGQENSLISTATASVTSSYKLSQQSSATTVGIDTGAANAYVVAFSPALTNPVPWAPFWFEVKTSNTGASTLNATGTAYPLVGGAHLPLQGQEMISGGNALVYWNPTLNGGTGSYVLLLCSGAPEQIAPATQPYHAAQLSQIGHGQCRLAATSGTLLTLSPYNGNNIIISGVPQQIPAAGITLANTGLIGPVTGSSYSITSNVCTYTTATAHNLVVGARVNIQKSFSGVLNGNWIVLSVPTSTTFTFAVTTANVTSQAEGSATVQPVYYAYVAMVAGTMTLLADQIGYALQTNGIATKSTDTTKTLVGMFMLNTSSQFASGVANQFVLNWFNRRNITATLGVSPAATFTNTTTGELTTTARLPFLCWGDDSPQIAMAGSLANNTTNTVVAFQMYVDAIIAANACGPAQSLTNVNANGGDILSTHGSYTGGVEGFHLTAIAGYVSAGTGTLSNIRTDVEIFG
jgi:hypothetical protein